jgi:hypothetical protein
MVVHSGHFLEIDITIAEERYFFGKKEACETKLEDMD